MSTGVTDVEALRLGLHLALSEFMGPDLLEQRDEDALAVRFVYEGLSVADAIDLATLYTYGTKSSWPVPPLSMDWQQWLDSPPTRTVSDAERAGIAEQRRNAQAVRLIPDA